MNYAQKEIKTVQVTTKSTRTTDCFRRREVKDDEGNTSVKVVRWQEDHQVNANLQLVDGERVFHNGARIA